jgi:protease IV
MRRFFGNVFAATLGFFIGGFLLFLIIGGIISSMASKVGSTSGPSVKSNSVLQLELKGQIVERVAKEPISFPGMDKFGGEKLGLNQILQALQKSAKDDKIKGLYIKLDDFKTGMATLEAIRNGLISFKESKKFIIAYGESMDEKGYYLASIADKVYMYPTGYMEWNGISTNPMFLRGTLDMLGVQPRVFKVGTFKSAAEMFTEKQLSEANRLQYQTFLNDFWNHMLDGISNKRNLPKDTLNAYASRIDILESRQAHSRKLIDGLMTWDQVEKEIKTLAKIPAKDKKINFVSIDDYSDNANPASDFSPTKIAVVYAIGEINTGEGDDNEIGSDDLVKEIRRAREDDRVKAVVLRVNSPGGSALASDIIAQEIELTKKVKPVIASYGDVAASGGYYISAKCDAIYAEPTTITGSIGVISLMMNTQQFMNNKFGITFDRVYSNDNAHADIFNPNKPIDTYEDVKMQEATNRIYSDFIKVVLAGRKKHFADSTAVDSIAQGRVWTGTRAKQLKLVDEVGGLDKAIQFAAEKAGLGKKDFAIVEYPKSKSFFESIFDKDSDSEELKVLNKFLPIEQIKVYRMLKSLNDPRGMYMRDFSDYINIH